MQVAGKDAPPVAHLLGEAGSLSSRSGAEIEQTIACCRRQQQGNQLRCLVLDRKEPLLETWQGGKRDR